MSEVYEAHGARSIDDIITMSVNSVSAHYSKGRSILVYCHDPKLANKFSERLWSKDDCNFIPHYFAGDDIVIPPRIIICNEDINDWFKKLNPQPYFLLNLSTDYLKEATLFENILEFVMSESESKRLARDRVLKYKQDGHEIKYFEFKYN
ncbi:DNA polymerase III subunit chi [Taylorella equigenitalis]|uniref:DNA polymerase III chi subunit n=2 Tax=Taylorella equigenitalis TaxID=29575 RepID=I7IXP1_9BURK|nr:DNA polymerase III subunit chi [Taylorella equigenitalis]AFN35596.1 DNA polymerase III chi subunit [Taylorella equigenitalis ATCC 35865]ASY37553.1 DNA polymerase III subunit chi [Taylorella equigenitalis]ASY39022.1 DNA polymerase III subunit chi [Taylorella equigenitalis]ASY40541.1 DNA polymerase III subunit chi [Taylorella equigenitalis]ASY41976.1 DNA polymerase III subunit chi [Taylorella equigenitalis]